ncbi:Coa1 domain-containing protein [Salix suchowensis]|nr:Coa1 domain-containing protein [Salix suchowensis]
MLARRFISLFKNSPSSQTSSGGKRLDEGKSKSFGRKAATFVLVTVTGGVALSALDDLAIYHGCSSKAMEKASNSQAVKDAIGEPIVKGPWYNASLAVAHKRQSVSCTFPVSGPRGNGVFQLKQCVMEVCALVIYYFFPLQSSCLTCNLSFSHLSSLSSHTHS